MAGRQTDFTNHSLLGRQKKALPSLSFSPFAVPRAVPRFVKASKKTGGVQGWEKGKRKALWKRAKTRRGGRAGVFREGWVRLQRRLD